jgi:hypothetical protein
MLVSKHLDFKEAKQAKNPIDVALADLGRAHQGRFLG